MNACDSVSSPVDQSGAELPQKHDAVFAAEFIIFIISGPGAFTQGLMGSRGGGGSSGGGWWRGISMSISLAAAAALWLMMREQLQLSARGLPAEGATAS